MENPGPRLITSERGPPPAVSWSNDRTSVTTERTGSQRGKFKLIGRFLR